MEIVRARIDVIFDELARLPPLPVAVPVAATHNQQRKCTAAWLYEHPQDAQLYSLGPTCAPSSWYRKMDLGASDHASALPLSILRASPFGFAQHLFKNKYRVHTNDRGRAQAHKPRIVSFLSTVETPRHVPTTRPAPRRMHASVPRWSHRVAGAQNTLPTCKHSHEERTALRQWV